MKQKNFISFEITIVGELISKVVPMIVRIKVVISNGNKNFNKNRSNKSSKGKSKSDNLRDPKRANFYDRKSQVKGRCQGGLGGQSKIGGQSGDGKQGISQGRDKSLNTINNAHPLRAELNVDCDIKEPGDLIDRVTQFTADSGVTKRLSNYRAIFRSINKSRDFTVRYTNSRPLTDFTTSGFGSVIEIKNDGKKIRLDEVMYAEALSNYSLSLSKLADIELSIYLDEEIIVIYGKNSRKTLSSEMNESPHSVMDLIIDNKCVSVQRNVPLN